ncbi:hypothetical protein LF1_35600 [Rubripirellula obstinata]|uniref:Phytase-like domain-containing protein n=1 Tax=Rubripirellula obstinata TaxID=406547 RepID=A0A5B1CIN2_9BACT|nr:hypothetical protein [Rubripirellula obstinata]KAA1261017.1 hypothetical protein LF1_35600 [Rubripirellula obstinata]
MTKTISQGRPDIIIVRKLMQHQATLLRMIAIGWVGSATTLVIFADEISSSRVLTGGNNAESAQHRPIDSALDFQCILDDSRIRESSGLAFSRRSPGHVWTHNDSGDKARLFALDIHGKPTGKVELKSKLKAEDWEDIAAMDEDGQSRLIVADCGDNRGKRKSITLLIFDEPDPTESTKLKNFHQIRIRYPDGAYDCEAIAIDADRREVLLFTKSAFPICHVFAAKLPAKGAKLKKQQQKIVAEAIITLALPMVTGADIDRQSGDLWLSSYLGALKYPHQQGLSLRQQLAQTPSVVKLPAWKQIEAIAVDHEGGVWVTSEGKQAPMGRLKCLKSNKSTTSIPPKN